MGPTQTPIQWVPGFFRDSESAGARSWALTPSNAEMSGTTTGTNGTPQHVSKTSGALTERAAHRNTSPKRPEPLTERTAHRNTSLKTCMLRLKEKKLWNALLLHVLLGCPWLSDVRKDTWCAAWCRMLQTLPVRSSIPVFWDVALPYRVSGRRRF